MLLKLNTDILEEVDKTDKQGPVHKKIQCLPVPAPAPAVVSSCFGV